jgi:mRNA-degrading endonuclease RelE of RelBE toxin-antitoxin system
MNVSIKVTKGFKRQVKPLIKKYVSLKSELKELQLSLIESPEQGILIAADVYKIKMGVKSKGRGKSGGVRIITFVETLILAEVEELDAYSEEVIEKVVNLIAIYDKADTESIDQHEVEMLLSEIEFDEE